MSVLTESVGVVLCFNDVSSFCFSCVACSEYVWQSGPEVLSLCLQFVLAKMQYITLVCFSQYCRCFMISTLRNTCMKWLSHTWTPLQKLIPTVHFWYFCIVSWRYFSNLILLYQSLNRITTNAANRTLTRQEFWNKCKFFKFQVQIRILRICNTSLLNYNCVICFCLISFGTLQCIIVVLTLLYGQPAKA